MGKNRKMKSAEIIILRERNREISLAWLLTQNKSHFSFLHIKRTAYYVTAYHFNFHVCVFT